MDPASRIDPICGMVGTIEHKGQWFCSKGCARKYDAQQEGARFAFLKSSTGIALILTLAGLFAGRLFAFAQDFSQLFLGQWLHYGGPMLIGIFLGGLLDTMVPKQWILQSLSGSSKGVLFRSAGLGFLASTCSHGCLALSMALYKKGASVASVITFLLASPWASLPFTILILTVFKWQGLLFVLLALGVALFTGAFFQVLEQRGAVANPASATEGSCAAEREGFSFQKALRSSWKLADMVLIWIVLGFSLSAVLGALTPHFAWHQWVAPDLAGLMRTLGVASLIEVCSEGSAPIAIQIHQHAGALGNAFVFLMAGVVTDFTELSMLAKNLGLNVVKWFLLATLPQIILLGILLNQL